MRLKAYSLLFALIVSTVVFGVTNSLLMQSLLFSKETSRSIDIVQVGLNAESGIHLGLLTLSEGEVKEVDLFNEGGDNVLISNKGWGGFTVLNSTSSKEGISMTKSVLCGNIIKSKYVINLKDNNRPLSLAGNTKIEGNCLLPSSGVKRAYIEGRSFSGKQLVQGQILKQGNNQSNSNFEAFNFFDIIESKPQDSMVFLEDLGDSIYHPFNQYTLTVVLTSNREELEGYYSGNIIFRSSDDIIIGPNCRLEDVIVIANSIIIESGFSGSGQFLAKQNVSINNSILEYPSLVYVKEVVNNRKSGISCINSKIVGGLVFSDKGNIKVRSGISIDQKSSVIGLIHSSSWVEMMGSVKGSIAASYFLLRTPSSVYQNHLLDASITQLKVDGGFPFITTQGKTERKIMKWLD